MKDSGEDKRHSWAIWLTTIAAVIFSFLALIYWLKANLDSHYIAHRCERRIERGLDPDVLRVWATNLLASYPPDRTNYSGPFQLPVGLDRIWSRGHPQVLLRARRNNEEQHVYVFWGSGVLGHW